jgi:hypothetical protein
MRYQRRRPARALGLARPTWGRGGRQVLGTDLNCSESRRWPALNVPLTRTRIARNERGSTAMLMDSSRAEDAAVGGGSGAFSDDHRLTPA